MPNFIHEIDPGYFKWVSVKEVLIIRHIPIYIQIQLQTYILMLSFMYRVSSAMEEFWIKVTVL